MLGSSLPMSTMGSFPSLTGFVEEVSLVLTTIQHLVDFFLPSSSKVISKKVTAAVEIKSNSDHIITTQ